MKKTVLHILLITSIATALPLLVGAQGGVSPVSVPENVNLQDLVVRILNFAFGLLLVVAALFIFFAAYLYLTSGGDEEKLKSARQYIIYAIVAIIVAFIARAIVTVVRQVIGA